MPYFFLNFILFEPEDPSRKQIATLNTNPNSFPAEDLTQRYSSLGIHDSAYVGPLNQIHSKGSSQSQTDVRPFQNAGDFQGWNQMGSSSEMDNAANYQWNTLDGSSTSYDPRGIYICKFFSASEFLQKIAK
ncbi:hypothetical protein HMI56_000068 [Coelomomyces lativittatus]|nr:hypothetical protein HMI56_000068 [Coelomomyces lativittatus]